MRKEVRYLGIGLLLALSSLAKINTLIPWYVYTGLGLVLLVYGSYLMISNYDNKKAMTYLVPVWILVFGLTYWNVSNNSEWDMTSVRKPFSTCEEAKVTAKKDIESGKFRQIVGSYGQVQPHIEILKKDYGIEIIEVDGVTGIPNECYNQIMHKALQDKFGKLYLNKAIEKANN